MQQQQAEAVQLNETEQQTKADQLAGLIQAVGRDARNRPNEYAKDSLAPAGGE